MAATPLKRSDIDCARASAICRTVNKLPGRFGIRAGAIEPWGATWSGDRLSRIEQPGDDNCMDERGAFCPKFGEVRARQALAELQLTEYNHRLANSLQKLVSRIERQRRVQDDPVLRDELKSLVTSVHAAAQLHRCLLPPRSIRNVDLAALLLNMAGAIEGVTGLLCDVEAEALTVSSPVAVNLAAVINELTWNAQKHAYSGQEGGRIRIVCRRDPDGRLRISVADQGCGLPAGFDPRSSEGLGFMVVCATTRRYDGELQAESNDGARFTLLLQIPLL